MPDALRPEGARLRSRAYLIGLFVMMLNEYWLVHDELVRWSLFTNAVPFCNAIFTLAALILVNSIAARFLPNRPSFLRRSELLCIFTMTCIGSALGSAQFMHLLIAYLPYPTRFAGAGNKWNETFVPYLPQWAMVSDPVSVKNFYNGQSSIYRPENFTPWLLPMAYWGLFIVVLFWTLLCINTILRRQWTVNERLSYPAVYLPMEMTSGPAFWKNRLLWIGFAFAGGLTFWNGIAYLYPSLPMIPIKRQNISTYFTVPPWKDIGTLQTSFYFFAIGISFLMPQDLSFSLWTFYALYKLELVMVSAMGLEGPAVAAVGFESSPPYERSQAFGAYTAVFVMALWSARPYLRDVWQTAFGRGPKPLDDSEEPMRYRTACLGAFCGFVALVCLCLPLGFSPLVAVAFFSIFLMISLMITRIMAEFGFPVHDMSDVGPLNLLMATGGTRGMGPHNMVGFTLTYWFNRTYFAHPMPHQLEGFKLADVNGTAKRDFMRAMMLAGVVGMVTVFWAYLHVIYQKGAGTAHVEQWPRSFPDENFDRLGKWFKTPALPNTTSLRVVVGGFLFAMLLSLLRQSFAWFPFHPLAYAVANSWGMQQIWMPIFIGSTAKLILLRYGGLTTYRRAVPLFLGLILGEMIVGCLWTLYGISIGIRTYDFWP